MEYSSAVLADNFWNDPTVRDLWIYTPPSYSKDVEYPVVVFLTGFGSTGESLLSRGLSDVSMARRIDRWIDAGCPEFIAVFPDCMSRLIGTQFIDSSAIGAYGSYVMKELLPHVAEHFSVSGKLGITGRSSGGYGALRLAMDFPGVNAISVHAGDVAFGTTYCGELSKSITSINEAGSPMEFIEAFWRKRRFSGGDFAAMNLLCMAAAYAPDTSIDGFPSNLPVDFETGEIFFDRFLQWKSHDPLVLIEDLRNQKRLRNLDLLFIDAGDRDEYNLHLGARRLCRKLEAFEIPHIYEEFPGGHRGTSWRYDVSIPRMVTMLSRG
jgi:enterochelin esterase-like enzyme